MYINNQIKTAYCNSLIFCNTQSRS